MAKRGQNIYKRQDGRYEGRFMIGHNEEGKPKFIYVYDRKLSGCIEKLNQVKLSYMNKKGSLKTYGKGTVKEFMYYWLYNVIKQNVRVSTFSNYETIINKWIVRNLGNLKLDKLNKEKVQQFVGELSEKGLSAGTVRNIYAVLNNAMKKAFEFEYVYRNPCDNVKLPVVERHEAKQLTMPEQKDLEEVVKEDKKGLPVLVAMYTGLRVGEICALKWSDIDLEKGVIRISRTIKRVHVNSGMKRTCIVEGRAKSRQSIRDLPLPVSIVQLLILHKEKSSEEYVFTYKNHPLEPRILQNRFKSLLAKADLRDLNFHALRHTFATRCLEQNIDVKTVSELLGHSSSSFTLDRYGHSQMEQKQKAMELLNKLFMTA